MTRNVGQAHRHRRLPARYVKEEMIAWVHLDISLLPSESGTLTENYRRVTSAAGRDTVMDERPRNGTEKGRQRREGWRRRHLNCERGLAERTARLPVRQHHTDFPFKSWPDTCAVCLIIAGPG